MKMRDASTPRWSPHLGFELTAIEGYATDYFGKVKASHTMEWKPANSHGSHEISPGIDNRSPTPQAGSIMVGQTPGGAALTTATTVEGTASAGPDP